MAQKKKKGNKLLIPPYYRELTDGQRLKGIKDMFLESILYPTDSQKGLEKNFSVSERLEKVSFESSHEREEELKKLLPTIYLSAYRDAVNFLKGGDIISLRTLEDYLTSTTLEKLGKERTKKGKKWELGIYADRMRTIREYFMEDNL